MNQPRSRGYTQIKQQLRARTASTAFNELKKARSCLEAAPKAEPTTTITVLQAIGASTRKEYQLGSDGLVHVKNYDRAQEFKWRLEPASDIKSLAARIEPLSKRFDTILIRGRPVGNIPQVARRKLVNFDESPEGNSWLLLDFDAVELPVGIAPNSREAIEALILMLPRYFHDVAYFYQFSSSAGILKPDGTPLKPGVSVHIFFWLDRPIPGKVMAAWLKLHCIHNNFLQKKRDRGGSPMIHYGVDEAVLRSPVQPHYVALPLIGDAVQCILPGELRQGLVEKSPQLVTVPELGKDIISESKSKHDQLLAAWKRECGFVGRTMVTRCRTGGVSVERYARSVDSTSSKFGRVFVKAELSGATKNSADSVRFARLYFVGESTPGSWWVCNRRPTVARRYGDAAEVNLEELSHGAFIYIRDELKWFNSIRQTYASLTLAGYLPSFESFITARYTLLLAPTGSGKTKSFCDYARVKCLNQVVLYAAQTIALTHQMADDLLKEGITAYHYQALPSDWREMRSGVYVTTNESLKKFVAQLEVQATPFILVIDEVHLAIDDFMRSEPKSRLLNRAIIRAAQSIFMTGTLTPLQIAKITGCIETAVGNLSDKTFEICEFQPVKSNELRWKSETEFGADVAALMDQHRALKANRQPLPRTVLIVPTSSMRPYELLLEHFGLTEDALVVSREETSQQDIEVARTSKKPWLISSPLFAIGLNFVHPPVRFWTCFGRLRVDESQIIQTVNRANRTNVPCEVRIYAGQLDPRPQIELIADQEREAIESFLLGETHTPGKIDPIFQLDRHTYLSLRKKEEKNTAKALYRLKTNDAIQNYHIVQEFEDDLEPSSAHVDLFKAACKDAKQSYDSDIAERHKVFDGENLSLVFHHLSQVQQKSRDFRDPSSVPKPLTDTRKAVLAAATANPNHVGRSSVLHDKSFQRLHGKTLPFISSQYSIDVTEAWRPATAQKVSELIFLVRLLESLARKEIDGTQFGRRMRQQSRRGVLALARSETDFLSWQEMLAEMDKKSAVYANASKAARTKLDRFFFEAALKFLRPIGIDFGKTKDSDGRERLDPAKPIVPLWDFARMEVGLEILAESVEHRPTREPDVVKARLAWAGANVSLALCQTCVHCSLDLDCALGRPVQLTWDHVEAVQDKCDAFVKISLRVLKLKSKLA